MSFACTPNGLCEVGESCRDCCEDCGSCPVVCGDHYCDAGETARSCRADCALPAWPFAIESCVFDTPCDGECAEFGSLPGEHACFTSLTAKRGNVKTVMESLPVECCDGNICGGGRLPARVVAGDPTNAVSGHGGRAFDVLAACLEGSPQRTEFRVPIIPCGSCGQATHIIGFAQLHIEEVRAGGRDRQLRGFACCLECGDGVCGECGDGVCGGDEVCLSDCGGEPGVCD